MTRWWPIVGGIAMNLALGSLYAWSVFVLPLEKEFGWTRAETSWVFSIAVVSFAASFVVAGRLQDRRGPRLCAALGAVLLGAGFILSSWTTSLTYLYVVFGVVVGVGNGFGYATPTPVASKWFPDRRGLVIGLMVGGYGAGSAIIGPIATRLIESIGWRDTFRMLGVVFLAMGALGTFLMRNPPAGYRPPGRAGGVAGTAARSRREYATGEMVRLPVFYTVWIAYCLGATAGLMVISQLVPFARATGRGAEAATLAITIAAVGNASGRILSGWMSDTLGRLSTLRAMVLVSAAAMPVLFIVRDTPVLFYLLVAVVYWCYGTQLSVFASATADFFGTRNLGMNYGVLFTAWGTAGIVGPIIAARVFDAFGDYRYAFYIAGALALVAFGALALARPPQSDAAIVQPAPIPRTA